MGVAASALKCYQYKDTVETFNEKKDNMTADVCSTGVKQCGKTAFNIENKGNDFPCSSAGKVEGYCGGLGLGSGTAKTGCVTVKPDSDPTSTCKDAYESDADVTACEVALKGLQASWTTAGCGGSVTMCACDSDSCNPAGAVRAGILFAIVAVGAVVLL